VPSGVVHYHYYKRILVVVVPASIGIMFINLYAGMGFLSGYFFHRWCDNDWDIMGASSSEGRMVNELPIVGHFLFGISSTYGSVFRKTHRKFVSHFPFFSTLIRLMFLGVPIFFFLKSFDFDFMQEWFQLGLLFFWLGLSFADSIHYLLDLLVGE